MTSLNGVGPMLPKIHPSPIPANTKLKRPASTPEQKAAERRIRRRVDPSKRKRVAVACDTCKRRKQKCDGQLPCNICRQRGFTCVFHASDHRRGSITESIPKSDSRPQTASPSITDEEVPAVGEGNPRLLKDPRGHLRFVGESSAHSFVKQIRELFAKTSGESAFTQDIQRFSMADGPTHSASYQTLQLPPKALADELTVLFERHIQPFSYVFHMDGFRHMLDDTYNFPMDCPKTSLCLIQLAFALAGLYKLGFESGKLFESGLGLCQDCVEDGDLWVVQAYLLISMYYQVSCKRNAMWITIGMAIRFAQALGMHRASVNYNLPHREMVLRQRVWRTLYIYDRFHSAVLGRPFTIADQDWDDREPTGNSYSNRISVEMARISGILGDICRKVYRPQTISSETASALARRLQEWSDALPPDMTLQSLLRNSGMPSYYRHVLQRLHLAHLNAVILLTRPFFCYVVSTEVMKGTPPGPSEATAKGTVARLAKACVLSAARSVDIVNALFLEGARPARPPFLIYFMFYAGLILLTDAYRDRSQINNPVISNVKLIMASYAGIDPSAKRYSQVFEAMTSAIKNSTAQPMDALTELFPENQSDVTTTATPIDNSLSFILGDDVLAEGMENIFNFDSTAYWDTMMMGEGDLRGMLLQPEF